MAEPQVYLSTAGKVLTNGGEVENQDLALVGQVAGLADDRVLAEVLRLAPFDGTQIYKAVVPFDYVADKIGGTSASPTSTVTPSGHADGSILVNPFRLVCGSRVTAISSPPQSVLDNWRDIRSGIFTGPGVSGDGPTNSALAVQLAANASGNPRWDLIYATISLDVQSNQVSRRLKDPASSNVTAQAVYQYLASPVTVTVVQGTPGATPTIPALPADGGGGYNFALAAVRVVNGFNSTTTLAGADIRMLATGAGYKSLRPGFQVEPATGNNDRAGTYDTNSHFAWAAGSAGSRPEPFVPPDMVGGKCILAMVTNADASSANWSHPDRSVVDDSIDWRKRIFLVIPQIVEGASTLATATSAAFGVNPDATGGFAPLVPPVLGNSLLNPDGTLVASTFTVLLINHSLYSWVPAGAVFGFYVDPGDGKLKWSAAGVGSSANPGCTVCAWIFASAAMPNH